MSVRVTTWAWAQKVGDAEAKLVLLRLADQANHAGYCWPSKGSIARGCEMSVSTIKRSIRYLVSRDLITIESRQRDDGSSSSNYYRFPRYVVDEGGSEGPPGGSDRPPGGSEGPGGRGSEGPPVNQLQEEPSMNQVPRGDESSPLEELNTLRKTTGL